MLPLVLFVCLESMAGAQTAVPPYDLWNAARMAAIRDQSTLNPQVSLHAGYADVFFTSNPSADWVDATPPYAVHHGEEIRIHGFLAWPGGIPYVGDTYPAILVGHGHGGHADRDLALMMATLGYVVLAIDGPQAGQSTGGPRDQNQAWISVDNGPEYGYLYHYAYAGMRALTLLEKLATTEGNPYRIDRTKFAVIGASMGGILASYMNGVDDRLGSAVIIASAGNWHHTLRYPNSWLYHGIYASTRDLPYNGSDPPDSVENIDTDPTVTTFINYFDPIRYAPRQHAPALTIIGSHDEYFPLPNANLMQLAMTSARTHGNFEKRLWLLPNAPHQFDTSANLIQIVAGVQQWLRYCFEGAAKPLARPEVTRSGLNFEASLAENSARLQGVNVDLWAAARVNSAVTPIQDFKAYPMRRSGDRFVAQIPAGERTSSGDPITDANVIYFATASAADSTPVSSLVYKGGTVLDLSSGFTPVLEQYPGDSVVAPVPADPVVAAQTIITSVPVPSDSSYQGMALSNPTGRATTMVLEARTPEGRIAAAEGLVNPVFMYLPAGAQKIFLAEEWLGPGARQLLGSLRASWMDSAGTSLAFRGDVRPSQLDGIGPLAETAGTQWLPLVPEQDAGMPRGIRMFAGAAAAEVRVVLRDAAGNVNALSGSTVSIPAFGDVAFARYPAGATVELQSSAPFAARLEVTPAGDPWSIDAAPGMASARRVQPHFELHGIFQTRVLAVNAGSMPAQVKFSFWTIVGRTETTRSIPAGAVLSETVESLLGAFPISAPARGWLEAEVTGGPVSLTALAVDPLTGASAASPFQAPAAGPWSMPFFVENAQYYTGLAIANPGETDASVTITAYDPAGNVIASSPANIGAHTNDVRLVAQWIKALPADSTGHIVIMAGAPIAPLAYFGTDDGNSLAAIPFAPVETK